VVDVMQAAQHWRCQKPVETIPFTAGTRVNVEALNAETPQSEWEPGLDGGLKEPWQLQHIVYLLDPKDGSKYTALNSTTGMRIAWEVLVDRVKTIRKVRNAAARPIVTLTSAPMKTKYGMKDRPEFKIEEWIGLPAPNEPKKLTAAEIIDDDLPF
jgi:hypothetical protein